METPADEPLRVVKADIRYRKTLFTAYGILIIAGVLFALVAMPYLRAQWRHLSLFDCEIIVIGFLVSFSGPALYLVSIGKKIRRHSQFPYPGMKVIHDTKVLSGNKALRYARLFTYLGWFACVLTILGSISVHRSFQKLNSELTKIFKPQTF